MTWRTPVVRTNDHVAGGKRSDSHHPFIVEHTSAVGEFLVYDDDIVCVTFNNHTNHELITNTTCINIRIFLRAGYCRSFLIA